MCLYFSPNPQARGNRSSGCCIQPHRNLTAARIARGRPPLLRRLLTRSALGLDGSTIMFSAVIAYGMIAVTPPELRRITFGRCNTPAPLARPFRTQKGSRRNADIQFGENRLAVPFYLPSHYIAGEKAFFTTKFEKIFKNF